MRHLALSLVLLCVVAAAGAVAGAALLAAPPASAEGEETTAEFKLGFRALADLIPDVAGQPLEEERPAADGGSWQRTTTGLMVWRDDVNWTGFTDGSRTWTLGPEGLAVRANAERFAWEPSAPSAFTDPFAYCAAVGTVDRPDERYVGPPIIDAAREAVGAALGGRPEGFNERNTFFRCLDRAVLVCTIGANLNCGQADARREPTPATGQYCQENPDRDFIPLFVVGHEGIYAWQCRGQTPVIARQVFQVDPRGFVAEFWHRVAPPGGKG